jgi:hypothetical protein
MEAEVKKLLVLAGIAIFVGWVINGVTSTQRDIAQAQMVIESAKAAQEAAKAANTAATGLSVVSGGQMVILLLLVVALFGTWALWANRELRRMRGGYSQNGILPPGMISQNGKFLGGEQRHQLPGPMAGVDVNQLIQLEMLRSLREMRQPQLPNTAEEEMFPW